MSTSKLQTSLLLNPISNPMEMDDCVNDARLDPKGSPICALPGRVGSPLLYIIYLRIAFSFVSNIDFFLNLTLKTDLEAWNVENTTKRVDIRVTLTSSLKL